MSKAHALAPVAETTHPRLVSLKRRIANRIAQYSRYYDEILQLAPRAQDDGVLLSLLDAPKKCSVASAAEIQPGASDRRRIVLLNGTFNHSFDIEGLLAQLHPRLTRFDRILAVAYNPYLAFVYRLANVLGLRKGELPQNFVTEVDLRNMANLAGFELVRMTPSIFIPFSIPPLTQALEALLSLVPVLRRLSLVHLVLLRPVPNAHSPVAQHRLSILIPARNERGNIEAAVKRMPEMGIPIEIVFIEGNSNDQTWEEILRVQKTYSRPDRPILVGQQTGKGKNDAVRRGIDISTGDLITILDADLTMPPELLPRFTQAFLSGKGDFVNGSRLVYPMEGEAMRFLNRLGNIFFAKSLSFVLSNPLGDSLCGTKYFLRSDYARFVAWRKDFGDFDPFGDFELLFPASILGLRTVDVPIRYLARTYGTTNISRFYHGFMLLKMTLIGLFRVRLKV